MANTGRVVVLTLKEMQEPANTPTGSTKINFTDDGDYIPPYVNTGTCPVTYSSTYCPTIVSTLDGFGETIYIEFSLPNSVINNPAIYHVKLILLDDGVEATHTIFDLPTANGNYFYDSFSYSISDTYTVQVQYLDNSSGIIHSCTPVAL